MDNKPEEPGAVGFAGKGEAPEDTPAVPNEPKSGTGGKRGRKTAKSSTLDVKHGHAIIKAYPVTGGELFSLGALGFVASLLFSMGAGTIGFSFDIFKDLELTTGLDDVVRERWKSNEFYAFWIGIGFFFVGAVLVVISGVKIKQVLDRTTFPGEE